jgi:hypothetical protein
LPVNTLPEDDDRPRVGAEEIAELIHKSPDDTAYLLTKKQLPAVKIGGKWHMLPSRWYRFLDEMADATLAEGAAMRRRPKTRAPRKAQPVTRRQRGWRGSSAASDAPLPLSATPK